VPAKFATDNLRVLYSIAILRTSKTGGKKLPIENKIYYLTLYLRIVFESIFAFHLDSFRKYFEFFEEAFSQIFLNTFAYRYHI